MLTDLDRGTTTELAAEAAQQHVLVRIDGQRWIASWPNVAAPGVITLTPVLI